MIYLPKRRLVVCIFSLFICFVLLAPQAFCLSLEQIISRRVSTRSYTSENISGQQLLELLHTAYGYNNAHRSVPQIGDDYALVIFPFNETGSYRYVPETNSIVVHDLSVNKNTVPAYDYYNQTYVKTANVILAVVWNQTRMDNGYFASAEAGCFVQNMYLAAVSNDIGTCCVGSIHSEELRNDLNLPSTLVPLLVMPLGYPETPYQPASPNYEHMTGNLPPVQYSNLTFEDAIDNIHFAQEWAPRDLSMQELSQLLWAAYGYTNLTNWGSDRQYHKTTPGIHYELAIYVSNATGVYEYLSEVLPDHTPQHSVMKILDGDVRLEIADACAGQTWAAAAPAIFLVVFNSSYNGGNTGDGMPQSTSHEFMEVSSGAVVQELFLEASAWNLSANIVSEGFEEWNGTAAEELRSILGLPPSLIPLYAVPVGAHTPVHDVATVRMTLSKTVVEQGYLVNITATVQNQGDFTEAFNVTLYANTTAIRKFTGISLTSGNFTTLTFTWNSTGFAKGKYTISGYATPVPNETDTSDNTRVAGTVTVTIRGDVDGDFDVDIYDVVKITSIYGFRLGDLGFNSNSDLDDDNVITIYDVVRCTAHYGDKDP
jgi:nitroreductase